MRVPGLVLCHGFPSQARGAAIAGATYPELADRIARDVGWAVLTFNFRGAGVSEGDFSINGWMADLRHAFDWMQARPDVSAVSICGAGTGGALAVCETARNPRVHGLATMAAPSSLLDWARDPGRLLHHARSIGLIKTTGFPADYQAWIRPLTQLDPVASARLLGRRPFMLLHGADDSVVPVSEARALAHGAGSAAELHVIHAAGHELRHDPRAVAALLGWLDRQTA
jgi:fermentation-respiration switch protein FrsA (DUF1100 family)